MLGIRGNVRCSNGNDILLRGRVSFDSWNSFWRNVRSKDLDVCDVFCDGMPISPNAWFGTRSTNAFSLDLTGVFSAIHP